MLAILRLVAALMDTAEYLLANNIPNEGGWFVRRIRIVFYMSAKPVNVGGKKKINIGNYNRTRMCAIK